VTVPLTHETSDDDERLVRYLLGRLPDRDAERIDELSITDDRVAWRLLALENDLVDAYLCGTLAGEALESFERFYLSSPRRREKVRIAEDLLRVTRGTATPEDSDEAPTPVRASAAEHLRARSRARRWYERTFARPNATSWGLAAAAVLPLLASGTLLFHGMKLQQTLDVARADRDAVERHARELEHQLSASVRHTPAPPGSSSAAARSARTP